MAAELCIRVKEIKGHCAVYHGNEKIYIRGPEIDLARTDKICIHALPAILHYAVALREGADPVKLGLAKTGKFAYVACVDPGVPFTEGGRVVFEIARVEPKAEATDIE
jgi:uncharacterized repeat protein (TIGR04076 family)